MKIHWTKTAIEHLVAIYEYIARDSAKYAKRVVDRITSRSEQIGKYPYCGREVPEYSSADVREVIEGPYRVIYRINDDRIDIVAVVHAARRIDGE